MGAYTEKPFVVIHVYALGSSKLGGWMLTRRWALTQEIT